MLARLGEDRSMINNQHSKLYWKTNKNVLLGYQPGELLCVDYCCGGGFAGAPERIKLGKAQGIASGQPEPQSAEFPAPSTDIEYTIGGRLFDGYHYCKKHLVETLN